MFGQGRPNGSRHRRAPSGLSIARVAPLILAAVGLCGAAPIQAAETTARLRVQWGGGEPARWSGSITLSAGALSDLRRLDIEADAARAVWLDDTGIQVNEPGPRVTNSLDITATGPADARLLIGLSPTGSGPAAPPLEITLSELTAEPRAHKVDEMGRVLRVGRAPGDLLRIGSSRDALVFAPGEVWSLTVDPEPPALPAARLRIEARLTAPRAAGGLWPDDRQALWSTVRELPTDTDAASRQVQFDIPMPREEGVYDLTLVARSRARLGLPQVVAERQVQLMVVSNEANPLPIAGKRAPILLAEIDPANPGWLSRVSNLSLIPSLRKGPWGDGVLRPVSSSLGQLVGLGPNGGEDAIRWQAFPLPVSEPGQPHVLEVDYPSDTVQSLGISIVEPNAAGMVTPVGLDSGVYIDGQGEQASVSGTHRITFWPRTKTPVALLTNRRKGTPAAFGRLRLRRLPTARLPREFAIDGPAPERMLAAYLDRPLLPEQFSAPQSVDAASGQALDDWSTFHAAGLRLVDYLRHFGHDGLLLGAWADGGAIYPSELLGANPRHDTGAYFASGQDPRSKDVLELLFRLFDRDGLSLTPVLHFDAPLPRLEALLHGSPEERAGLELVGDDGATWLDRNEARRGLAPYYNPLDPRVRAAMLDVVAELVGRYGHHPSFAGVGIRLSADGYAQLPGARWGLDDATIERFQTETGRAVPGSGPERFALRAGYLTGKGRSAWLTWRCQQLESFYRAAEEKVTSTNSQARLYVLGAGMLDSPQLAREWSPALPRRESLDRAMLDVGIFPDLGQRLPGTVFPRPQRIGPPSDLMTRGVELDWNESTELDLTQTGVARPASLLFHPPREAQLPSFDTNGPFHQSNLWLASQMSPSGMSNRQRFVHALASTDAQFLADGGWMLPVGQEASLREFITAYRTLPAGPFATVDGAMQPLTMRALPREGRTYVYAVNDSPWKATARVRVSPAGTKLTELAAREATSRLTRDPTGAVWELELPPYGIASFWFASAQVNLSEPQVTVEPRATEELEGRIERLQLLAATLRNPSAYDALKNASFEQPATTEAAIPAWSVSSANGVTARVEGKSAHDGAKHVRFISTGPVATLVSSAIDPPRTGRLTVSAWLRVADGARQPPLRLAIAGKLDGRDYDRHAIIGGAGQSTPIDSQWAQYIFQVSDLPTEGLTDLRIRFDMLGAGEVSIDHMQLFDLVFSKDERIELDTRIIALARAKLRRGEVADCQRLLNGYWPRYLEEHVRVDAIARQPDPAPPRDAEPPREARKPTWGERLREWLPERMRY